MIEITTYNPTVIKETEKNINDIKLTQTGHICGVSTIVVGGLLLIVIVGMCSCLIWQRKWPDREL